ncbi:NDP-hexose 2,3-dehydratase family protein [Candidatus Neomarinimicrobiota bacterium]
MNNISKGVKDILTWRDERQADCALTCTPIPLSRMNRWNFIDGRIVHDTGRFFSVIGVHDTTGNRNLHQAEQPLLDQPEIGILGFLLRRTNGSAQLLVQAKAEPGNIGDVQFSPTVQATHSNYMRFHGGAPTRYLNYFTQTGQAATVSDTLQSVQGTRFLGKYNRNVTLQVDGQGPDAVHDSWRWQDLDTLLQLLSVDYSVNTDARSVLTSTSWEASCLDRQPFEGWRGKGGFGEDLYRSYTSKADQTELSIELILQVLDSSRKKNRFQLVLKPIHDVAGWKQDGDSIEDVAGSNFDIRGYRITVRNREVGAWDQPLSGSYGEGLVILLCQRRRGTLHFLFQGSIEIGFREYVQFGPSIQHDGSPSALSAQRACDPLLDLALSESDTVEHLSCTQSDEGGRFYQNIANYRIVEVAEDIEVPVQGNTACWMTLGQIATLLRTAGVFTNEARSVLSLLLGYL